MINSFKKKSIFFIILIGLIPLLSGVLVSVLFSIGQLSTGYLMWMITAITTVLIISISIPLVRVIGQPIAEVSSLCQEIVHGDLPTKVEITCKDEIGAVAESLSKIASFLHDTKIKLDLSERKYQLLMEGANDAIILLDSENGRIIKSNKKCEELTGFSENELLKMKFDDLHPE
ncbi:MAG TPA: PAS domain S-box protein, partial [Actinobacteria bacterium]|nr:PAS domain S-box protein [Actinomycetes bacterium]HEX21264.1 PAS domain S-box protein [Actinomycetota bacterium]